ncbi:ndufb9, NADH-ubiquinone oxidoreductase [Desmophyllum pertusum]|uniref:NADH dehydrogenase [ubiquinone] 1 beta subcomplex subunit 9 n=1 Tax=Desmophyllum pertusum TaxID=174260 RepID=A0A9W9Z482_9CNID|nr:ndufb9, NADH-ubiquinone oxidoreductase [Desmophyllum pertusum]
MAYIASHLTKGITHQQRVTRLYRNSLKHLLSWCIDRQLWRREAVILRERFDENKYERDQRKIFKILEGAEREFEKMKHPFPYTHPESQMAANGKETFHLHLIFSTCSMGRRVVQRDDRMGRWQRLNNHIQDANKHKGLLLISSLIIN